MYDVVPSSAAHYLENMEHMLRSREESDCVGPAPPPFWDPALARSRKKLLSLYRHLIRIGIVLVAAPGSAKAQLGIFLVKILGKDQDRLIIDARGVNRFFIQPIPLGMNFSKARCPKFVGLFSLVYSKRDLRALSFELWKMSFQMA